MSKFKMKMKIQGFELEIEGTRDDVPMISNQVGKQIAGMLEPTATIVQGDSTPKQLENNSLLTDDILPQKHNSASGKSKKGKKRGSYAKPVDWVHDTSKWGAPRQAWYTAQKAIWLLYVVKQEKNITELTSAEIRATFNKHFKEAKMIETSKVTRDLGKRKSKQNSPVSENTTKNPSTWFLTEEGFREAQKLVAEARGQQAESDNGTN